MSILSNFNILLKSLNSLRFRSNEIILQGVSYSSNFTNFNYGCTTSLCRQIHFSTPRNKSQDRKTILASIPAKDQGTEGEMAVGIDHIKSREDMFPNEDTPNRLFSGIPFKDIPVCYIRVSPNNTIMTLADGKTGTIKITRSCGIEGFKHTRKGTNVAAQATAITFSGIVLERGYKTVRVCINGLGPGRMSAIKGLQMGGLDIISVSDTTPVSENPPRPPRPKSL